MRGSDLHTATHPAALCHCHDTFAQARWQCRRVTSTPRVITASSTATATSTTTTMTTTAAPRLTTAAPPPSTTIEKAPRRRWQRPQPSSHVNRRSTEKQQHQHRTTRARPLQLQTPVAPHQCHQVRSSKNDKTCACRAAPLVSGGASDLATLDADHTMPFFPLPRPVTASRRLRSTSAESEEAQRYRGDFFDQSTVASLSCEETRQSSDARSGPGDSKRTVAAKRWQSRSSSHEADPAKRATPTAARDDAAPPEAPMASGKPVLPFGLGGAAGGFLHQLTSPFSINRGGSKAT